DLAALGSVEAVAKLLLSFCLFLVVRGAPALLLYRTTLKAPQRLALAFYLATELPLVVAITTLAVKDRHMKPATSARPGGAAMLSTLVFPFVADAIQKRAVAAGEVGAPEPAPAAA